MNTKEKGSEVKVGIFICVGLAVICTMIVEFGLGGGQGFKKYYSLNVDLPNANGLLKGSDVLLAGSPIGFVASKPMLSSNLGTVRATIKIGLKTKIPRGSTFKVDSSGLLGDKFVAIQTPPDFNPDQFNPDDPKQAYVSGDAILGTRTTDIVEQAGPALKKLSDELDELQKATIQLKDGLLSETNLKNVQLTLANLKTTSENFAGASKGVGAVVQNAQEAVDKAKETMTTAQDAAAELRKVLETAKGVIQKASQGDGLIPTLLTNRQLSENLKALVINLREHGVLFYKNSNSTSQQAPTPAREIKKR